MYAKLNTQNIKGYKLKIQYCYFIVFLIEKNTTR